MYKKYINLLLLILIIPSSFLSGQAVSPFSFNAVPGALIPISDSKDLYTTGATIGLNGEYYLPFSTMFYGKGMMHYNMLPTLADTTMTILDFDLGAGICIPASSRMYFKLAGSGGYYVGMLDAESGSDPCMILDSEFRFLFSRSFSLGLSGAYHNYLSLSQSKPLFQGIGVSLGLTYNLGASSRDSEIDFRPSFDPVFPVFYKYYDDNTIGSALLQNGERGTINDVKVSFYVPEFMEEPKLCREIEAVGRNEEIEVPLYALFTEDILKVTEGTKVSAEIIVEYRYLGGRVTGKKSETLVINNRNAMTWDDDRKAAAFVTSKDPAVLRFSKAVASDISNHGGGAVNSNFRTAMGLFETVSLFGIGYVIDPRTPYAEFSESDMNLDYLQFPIQTLTYRAGDCDDLSILYCALLESVGIETAFITVPGHIYMAFSLGIDRNEAEKLFTDTDDLIFINNETWVPVEITLVKDGFIKAWETGARQWRTNNKAGKASFYLIHEAWSTYEPVGMTEADRGVIYPESDRILDRYWKAMNKFIDREIFERASELKASIAKTRDNQKLVNKLGVLYARYGMYDRAEAEFIKAASGNNYMPALMNLGNIHYINGRMDEARGAYLKVLDKDPSNSYAHIGLAKTSFELNDYNSVVSSYKIVERNDPVLAEKYSYLMMRSEDTGRASSAVKEDFEWEE